MEIEKRIDEVQNYFLNKVVVGDYELIEVERLSVKVKIDNKYMFDLWLGSDPVKFFSFYLPFPYLGEETAKKFTENQKICAWSKLESRIKEYMDKIGRAQKIEQLKRLQEELGIAS